MKTKTLFPSYEREYIVLSVLSLSVNDPLYLYWTSLKSRALSSSCFFVCLDFFVPHENFSLIGDVTIACKGLQILTYARHLWPLSSEGSLACHTYCDTGDPFIMVISEDPWHSHLMPSGWQWSNTTCLWTKACRNWDSNTQLSAGAANHLTHCAIAAAAQNVSHFSSYRKWVYS